MSILGRLDSAFRSPLPPARLALVRVLVGLFGLVWLIVQVPAFGRLASAAPGVFAPVAPLRFLSAPVPPAMVFAAVFITLASGLAFVRGLAFRVAGPVFALGLLFLASYRSSFGMVFHTDNLLVMHAAILALTPQCAAVLAPGRPSVDAPAPRFGWPIRVVGLATTLAYLLAGLAKVDGLGIDWVEGSVLRGHVAYDALRKMAVGGSASPIGVALLSVPGIFAPLAAFSLAFELAAPLALFHRRLGWLWCAGVWSFHVGVAAMMLIGFPYPLSGIAFASFFPLERIFRRRWAARALGWLTGASGSSS